MDPVQIGNMSLLAIGAQSSVTGFQSAIGGTNDGSNESNQLSLLYDSVRQGLLRQVYWNFARKEAALTQLKAATDTDTTCPQPWQFEYAFPSDCLRVRHLLPTLNNTGTTNSTVVPSGSVYATPWYPNSAVRFIVGNDVPDSSVAPVRVILTDLQYALAVYTNDITDPNMFDTNFVDALVHLLASRLVLNLSGDKNTSVQMVQMAQGYISMAQRSDGNEGTQIQNRPADWISARGYDCWDDGYYNGAGGAWSQGSGGYY